MILAPIRIGRSSEGLSENSLSTSSSQRSLDETLRLCKGSSRASSRLAISVPWSSRRWPWRPHVGRQPRPSATQSCRSPLLFLAPTGADAWPILASEMHPGVYGIMSTHRRLLSQPSSLQRESTGNATTPLSPKQTVRCKRLGNWSINRSINSLILESRSTFKRVNRLATGQIDRRNMPRFYFRRPLSRAARYKISSIPYYLNPEKLYQVKVMA